MAEAPRDYYEVLGIPRDANDKAIKDAFRQLALKYHPDRNKSPDAEERFKEIAEAYAVLSDPKKRAEYDARGHAAVEGFSVEDLFSGIDFGDIFGNHFADFGFGFGDSLFDRLFRRPRGPAKGRDLEVRLTVPLERIYNGGKEAVRISRTTACPACHGSGAEPGTAPRRCDACDGTGRKVLSRRDEGGMHFEQITTCPICRGSGMVIDSPCSTCHGQGWVEREETLTVNIPIGAEEGMVLRVPGHGLTSKEGGPSGDLFVVVHSATDPRFKRDGADLWRIETIELADAVLGGRFKVPTMNGEVEVTIPPGTQPDEILRLRGKGLPYFGGDRYGNLNLRIQVHIPERLSARERKLFEQLRELGKDRS